MDMRKIASEINSCSKMVREMGKLNFESHCIAVNRLLVFGKWPKVVLLSEAFTTRVLSVLGLPKNNEKAMPLLGVNLDSKLIINKGKAYTKRGKKKTIFEIAHN